VTITFFMADFSTLTLIGLSNPQTPIHISIKMALPYKLHPATIALFWLHHEKSPCPMSLEKFSFHCECVQMPIYISPHCFQDITTINFV
jgi:hypothetical protein